MGVVEVSAAGREAGSPAYNKSFDRTAGNLPVVVREEGRPDDAIKELLAALHDEDSELTLSLEKRFSEIKTKLPFARVNPVIDSVRKSERPDLQSAVDKVVEALEDARSLASIESGNPIRLLW